MITCKTIWNATSSPTKDKISCCESCHVDDEEFSMGLIEVYEDEIDKTVAHSLYGKVIAEMCCTVSNALDAIGKEEFLLKLHKA